MGTKDHMITGYFRDKRRFADLFNGICFAGKEVIQASELEDAGEDYVQTGDSAGKKKGLRRARDIKMRLRSGETLRLLALENQSQVDYTMPVRCMRYDAMEYEQQIKELKRTNRQGGRLRSGGEYLCGIRREERLMPVYTLCLYHGEEAWDGPRSLKDMMDFGEDEDRMSCFFADYPMHLLIINEEKDFEVFHTEIRQLFRALKYRKDKKGLLRLLEKEKVYSHLDMETLEVVSVLMDIPKLWANREKYRNQEEKEETGNMCQAIRELMEDAKQEGLEQGLEKNIKAFIEFAQEMRLDKAVVVQKIMEKYGFGESKSAMHVEKYWQ